MNSRNLIYACLLLFPPQISKVETLSLYTQRVGSQPVGVCTKAVSGQIIGRDGHYQMLGSSGLLLAVHVPSQGRIEVSY